MPTFCRHNRFTSNCPICSKELEPATPSKPAARAATRSRGGGGSSGGSAVRIRRAARRADDGYRNPLVPGLRVEEDARALAAEVGFAAARLDELRSSPPGPFSEVASAPDAEEATWLAFLLAYISPGEGPEAFDAVQASRTSWASGELPPDPPAGGLGPRTAHEPRRGMETVTAYRRWAQRAGSQAAAFTGEEHWDAERRFARAFERLALPGFHRSARFDLLTALGNTGRYEMRAGSLLLAGAAADDDTAVAAKRVFGIADPMLIDRRAQALAAECQVALEALDLALYNWHRGVSRDEPRATLGAGAAARADTARAEQAASALDV